MIKNLKKINMQLVFVPLLLSTSFCVNAMQNNQDKSALQRSSDTAFYSEMNNLKDSDPLAWAAFNGDLNKTRTLLQEGILLKSSSENSSALHVAAYQKNVDILRLLLTFPSMNLNVQLKDHKPQELVRLHFAYLAPFLAAKTTIIGRQVTPYEAACDLGHNQNEFGHSYSDDCMKLLEPATLELRLHETVVQNYLQKLNNPQ